MDEKIYRICYYHSGQLFLRNFIAQVIANFQLIFLPSKYFQRDELARVFRDQIFLQLHWLSSKLTDLSILTYL